METNAQQQAFIPHDKTPAFKPGMEAVAGFRSASRGHRPLDMRETAGFSQRSFIEITCAFVEDIFYRRDRCIWHADEICDYYVNTLLRVLSIPQHG